MCSAKVGRTKHIPHSSTGYGVYIFDKVLPNQIKGLLRNATTTVSANILLQFQVSRHQVAFINHMDKQGVPELSTKEGPRWEGGLYAGPRNQTNFWNIINSANILGKIMNEQLLDLWGQKPTWFFGKVERGTKNLSTWFMGALCSSSSCSFYNKITT